jgi:hypothetical protein
MEWFTGEKENAPMINLCRYSDDRAITENVISVSGLMLDIDGECTIEEMEKLFGKYRYCWYTSSSHTEEVHKFRFILPFVKAMSRDEYVGFKKGIQSVLEGKVDASSVAVSRRFYAPTGSTTSIGRRGSKNKGKYLKLADMFPYEKIENRAIVTTTVDTLGSAWYKVILKTIMGDFRRAFYENNRHQAIINCTLVLSRNGYDADMIIAEMEKVDCYNERTKYSSDEVRQRVEDTIRRNYV